MEPQEIQTVSVTLHASTNRPVSPSSGTEPFMLPIGTITEYEGSSQQEWITKGK